MHPNRGGPGAGRPLPVPLLRRRPALAPADPPRPERDIWLIGWLPSQGTELHDHGGSAGAFTVLRGELAEACYVGTGSLPERRHPAGRSIGFGSRHIHDVRNLSDAPAVSVHAYSRPLTLMNYYELSSRGRLRTVESVPTTHPEEDRRAS